MSGEHGREAADGPEHEVEIRGNGLRAIPDETKGEFLLRSTSHIGAEKRCGLPLLLLVPRSSVAEDVPFPDFEGIRCLQVMPEFRVFYREQVFGKVAIEQGEL